MPRLKFGLKSRPKPVSDLHTPAVQYKRLLRHCFSSLNTVELLLRSLSQKKKKEEKEIRYVSYCPQSTNLFTRGTYGLLAV